jgi:hypothetical protein
MKKKPQAPKKRTGRTGNIQGKIDNQPNRQSRRQALFASEVPIAKPGKRPHSPRYYPAILPLIIFICSAFVLAWNIDAKYLWQDEAATAILGERLLSFGSPLGYDGKNLITNDFFRAEDEAQLQLCTDDPSSAVKFFVRRHDFKKDTTWTAHPWGQFLAAGISLSLLGHTTLAARLPFALAGAMVVTLLFVMVRRHFSSALSAYIAAALLIGNTFWFLHMRQCRYYALSALLLLLTLECYLRWQEGKRWAAAAFISAAWIWFHQDFGSLWPVLAILALDSLVIAMKTHKKLWNTMLVFAVIGVIIAPFTFFYDMFDWRLREAVVGWPMKIWTILFQINQFQLALIMIPLVIFFLWRERLKSQDVRGRHLVILSVSIICASILWMGKITPYPFFRYLIPLASLSAIVSAYGIVSLARLFTRAQGPFWRTVSAATVMAILFLATNVPSLPGSWVLPKQYSMALYTSSVVRPELRVYLDSLRGYGADPNRATVEFLRKRLSPEDEVICNYEDMPLMFYLQNHILGGTACFRLTDSRAIPKYAVIRRSALGLTHLAIYTRALAKYKWAPHVLDAPDITWGNNPDPMCQHTELPVNAPPLVAFERVSNTGD